MVKACILIKVVPTRVEHVLERVRGLKETGKAYPVYGRWDIVAFIEVPEYGRLKELTGEINRFEGVRSTETLAEA
ncbi:MAG: Lrp/AsnC ligand binding domain-containing protein [Candidatus Bathyarchaeia archaeon]|nr:Lrp/AsnC ligand binding domain-containing protein [Candidatus Bathyarchaeota archaeon]